MVFSGFGQTGFSIYQNPLKSHPPHGSFLVFILCPVTIHLFVCISGNKVISEPNTYFPICFSRMGVWGKPLFGYKERVPPQHNSFRRVQFLFRHIQRGGDHLIHIVILILAETAAKENLFFLISKFLILRIQS